VLKDARRSGRKPTIPQKTIEAIVHATISTKPRHTTHWSVRSMAAKFNVSPATVGRIWQSHRLQPHRIESFKFSTDPQFTAKVKDVVGLYLNPPRKALVFSVDEKSQIQALERTAPILPLRPDLPERQTHDYWRNGTTTLFAALNVLDGSVIGKCLPRHRNEEFTAFLETVDQATPKDLEVHLIMDNYATHKHENVRKWIAAHPRYHVHFTQRVRRGSAWSSDSLPRSQAGEFGAARSRASSTSSPRSKAISPIATQSKEVPLACVSFADP
jgi:hypothetical protein